MTDSATLRSQSCVPCRGGVAPMAAGLAEARLTLLQGWTLQDEAHRLERAFAFKTFAAAFAFVTRVAALADAENHHPDISFGWGYAKLSLQTHVIKGLHENDFILAAKIDAAFEGC